MKKRYLLVILMPIIACNAIDAMFDAIKEGAKSIGNTVEKGLEKAGDVIGDAASTAKDASVDFFASQGARLVDSSNASKKVFTENPDRIFCAADHSYTYAPTVKNADVRQKDYEGMIPTIEKYAPIAYLCKNEVYYPVAVEDYFLHPDTQLVYHKNHDGMFPSKKKVILPRGEVTMEKIYNNRTNYKGKDFFFEIGDCTRFGSNPQNFEDAQGNLRTPVYVTWSKQGDKIYIVYVFVYAYNGDYGFKIAGIKETKSGSHDFDLEHIVLELDSNKRLLRIFFAAHGKAEGVWLPADHKDIMYEGTHPIVHVASRGHGSYPRMGTHVRIYGIAPDITCEDKKWIPELVLLYPETDERFNPKTMGWAYHSGNYGKQGVDSFKRFFGANALKKGQPHSSVQFCPNPRNVNNKNEWKEYTSCIDKKSNKAKIPGMSR